LSIKALQDYTFISKYARYLPELKRRETWEEAVNRVREMHLENYKSAGIDEDINWAMDMVLQKKVLGSQRALQFGGDAMMKHNARGYNCCFSYIDRPEVFQQIMYLLLCGAGVGFSVQKHHVAKLPKLAEATQGTETFVIDDSIEGWADAIGALINASIEGRVITFDYSEIRPKGSPFSHGIGKAPGPDGLRNTINKIQVVLNNVWARDRVIRPIDAYDIIMHVSDAVLSGGVRRSATIALFSHDDVEMMNAKAGDDWATENPQRGRSNNSAVLLRGETTKEQFMAFKEITRKWGEPGFVWVDDLEMGVNPCAEIGFYAYDDKGNSGIAFCNLTEINGKKCKTEEEFMDACKASAILGTLQAGYTNFPYLGSVTENIARREALLGCSITGLMDSHEILLDPKIQRKGAKLILEVNERIATAIGINPTARATCIKPSGTTSCILGTASGIHPHHAKRYLRRVQANKIETPLIFFKASNPTAVEESVWSPDRTDEVITFCIEVPDGTKTKNQIGALELLENVKSTQQNWVTYGKNTERCAREWLQHNVSNTINVQDDEWDDVFSYIYRNRNHFTGLTLLSSSGDKDYQQAPNCTVYTPREMVSIYGDASVFASGVIEVALQAYDGNLWNACKAVLNHADITMPKIMNGSIHTKFALQITWIEKAKKFADKYFDGDIKKMTYCLKDVYNWKQWVDLQKVYIDVDYSEMIEEEDNTKLEEALACVGGACELPA